MTIAESAGKIAEEVARALSQISNESAELLCGAIIDSPRVFVAETGRSGLMARTFAMRLMHLGLDVAIVGETLAPPIRSGDRLVVCSGSGETSSLVSEAQKARGIGAKLALVTIFPRSSIGQAADLTVRVPAPTPKAPGLRPEGSGAGEDSKNSSIQPMGSLFKQSLLLLLDAIVLRLMERLDREAGAMFLHHANLE